MASVYDEIEIEDMAWDAEKETLFYPCPCGDKFFITLVRVRRRHSGSSSSTSSSGSGAASPSTRRPIPPLLTPPPSPSASRAGDQELPRAPLHRRAAEGLARRSGPRHRAAGVGRRGGSLTPRIYTKKTSRKPRDKNRGLVEVSVKRFFRGPTTVGPGVEPPKNRK